MTNKELFEKNQQLSTEFDLYLLEHPEFAAKIPDEALVVLLPKFDKGLGRKNLEMAKNFKEKNRPVVYITVDHLLASRLEGLHLSKVA